jgi:hypothetical protein
MAFGFCLGSSSKASCVANAISGYHFPYPSTPNAGGWLRRLLRSAGACAHGVSAEIVHSMKRRWIAALGSGSLFFALAASQPARAGRRPAGAGPDHPGTAPAAGCLNRQADRHPRGRRCFRPRQLETLRQPPGRELGKPWRRRAAAFPAPEHRRRRDASATGSPQAREGHAAPRSIPPRAHRSRGTSRSRRHRCGSALPGSGPASQGRGKDQAISKGLGSGTCRAALRLATIACS